MKIQTRRFMVWKAYHELKNFLKRIPSTLEVAEKMGDWGVDIKRDIVKNDMNTLNTCEVVKTYHENTGGHIESITSLIKDD